MEKETSCCSCNSGCCPPKKENKQITIDFLYLDLSVCTRCQGTDKSLEEAISEASKLLQAAGYEIILNKVNITSEDLAYKYEFISSPTIRVNGKDIAMDVKETVCEDCGDLCGDQSVECRVWTYEGEDYNIPPKAFIINAMLMEVYAGQPVEDKKEAYVLPENLKKFYSTKQI
jgi:hypothetical protein